MFPKTIWLLVLIGLTGCRAVPPQAAQSATHPFAQTPDGVMPRELQKVVMPEYIIEAPDVLLIEAINVVPRAPYPLRTTDVVSIEVTGTLPDAPIGGAFVIEPGGTIDLGFPYGRVTIAGLDIPRAKAAIEKHLAENHIRTELFVRMGLLRMSGTQQIAGEHLVKGDGTVTLGSYGSVPVVGLTIAQAKVAVENYLSQYLDNPLISLDVFAFNSKSFYVITEGAGLGTQVTKLPITGNETVLDALAQMNGLTQISSQRIWIARPTRGQCPPQILPVDWVAITAQASPTTNYQILPGDRIFIGENKWVRGDTGLAKILAPIERTMGFSLLGASTATRFSGRVLQGGGNPNNGGGGGGP